MILPLKMSGAEKRERMALMEAAISSSLCHPNIIRTFTYTLTPVRQPQPLQARHARISAPALTDHDRDSSNAARISGRPLGSVSAFEVQIVLEFCDQGTLKAALQASSR